METKTLASSLNPHSVNAQLKSVNTLSVETIQTVTHILNHCMPAIPSGFYILSIVLKHLQRLCSHNVYIVGTNDMHLLLCNLLKQCLTLFANICDAEKLSILWHAFAQILQNFAKGSMQMCNVVLETLSQPLLELTLNGDICASLEQKKEFVRVLNELLSNADKMLRIRLGNSLDDHLCRFTELLLTCGDYDYQVSIMELIFHFISINNNRKTLKHWFNGLEHIYSAFVNTRFLEFDMDCRKFINMVNESMGNKRQVYSFSCLKTYLGETELCKPNDEKYGEFWIDFNIGSKVISFYCDGSQLSENHHMSQSAWKLISIHSNMVKMAKLYKRDIVQSSRTGHCTVVIEFIKYNGNKDDVYSWILSQCYLKFIFHHTHELSLANNVLPCLYKETFQVLNCPKAASLRSSITPLVSVIPFKSRRNREYNKRVKVSLGEMTPVNNRKKFEPLIIKKSTKHIKEVSPAGVVHPGSLSYAQVHQDILRSSDDAPDTQSSDPTKDLKGKLTEKYIEKFSKQKVSLAVSPQLSNVSEEKLIEVGGIPCFPHSHQQHECLERGKSEKTKMSHKDNLNTQLCVPETKDREPNLKMVLAESGERKISGSLKVDSNDCLVSTVLKLNPRVLLKKLSFCETSTSWPLHIDATKSTINRTAGENNEIKKVELKYPGSETLHTSYCANDSLFDNLLTSDKCTSTDCKKTPDISNINYFPSLGPSDLQNKLQISNILELKSIVNQGESHSIKQNNISSVEDLDICLQNKISENHTITFQNNSKVIDEIRGDKQVDCCDRLENLKMLHNDRNIIQSNHAKSIGPLKVLKESCHNAKTAVSSSVKDVLPSKNNNTSMINMNLISETQQTLVLVNDYNENLAVDEKEHVKEVFIKESNTSHKNAEVEVKMKNKKVQSKNHNMEVKISPNEFVLKTGKNKQKTKGNNNSNIKNSSELLPKISETLLADWEDNTYDKVFNAASCLSTHDKGNDTESRLLNTNTIKEMTVFEKPNSLHNDSSSIRKESNNNFNIGECLENTEKDDCQHASGDPKIKKASVKEISSNVHITAIKDEKNKEIEFAVHSKNTLDSEYNSKVKNKSNKKPKANVIHQFSMQDDQISKYSNITVFTDDPKLEKGNRGAKKRKLYSQNGKSDLIHVQDLSSSSDTIRDSRYGFKITKKKQRMSKSFSEKECNNQTLVGGIFDLESLEDSACSTDKKKLESISSFKQSFHLNFSMNKGYNRWYTKYKEECLKKYHNKQNKRGVKKFKENSVYSDFESEDSVLSWLPPEDEKKIKKRNEKLSQHLNKTARKYEKKKPLNHTIKSSSNNSANEISRSYTFVKSKAVRNDSDAHFSEKIHKMEASSKKKLQTERAIPSEKRKLIFGTARLEKSGDNSSVIDSSSEDDRHLRNMPLSMRLSYVNKPLNKNRQHKQISTASATTKKDNLERAESSVLALKPEKINYESKNKYSAIKTLDSSKATIMLANEHFEYKSIQSEVSSHNQLKSNTFNLSHSENNLDTTQGFMTQNDQTEYLSTEKRYKLHDNKQYLSSKNEITESDVQSLKFTDNINFHGQKTNIAYNEEGYSTGENEIIFSEKFGNTNVDKIHEILCQNNVEHLENCNSNQISREDSDPNRTPCINFTDHQSLSAEEDLQFSEMAQYSKTEENKKLSTDLPGTSKTSTCPIIQEKITEKKRYTFWNNEVNTSSASHSSYIANNIEMKGSASNLSEHSSLSVKRRKNDLMSSIAYDSINSGSNQEQEKMQQKWELTESSKSTKIVTSPKARCYTSEEFHTSNHGCSNKNAIEMFSSGERLLERGKEILESTYKNDKVVSISKPNCINLNESSKHITLELFSSDGIYDEQKRKTILEKNENLKISSDLKSPDVLSSPYFLGSKENRVKIYDTDKELNLIQKEKAMSVINNYKEITTTLESDCRILKSFQHIPYNTGKNIAEETIVSNDEYQVSQKIMMAYVENANNGSTAYSKLKCTLDESCIASSESSESIELEISAKISNDKSSSFIGEKMENIPETTEPRLASQDIFQHYENLDCASNEIEGHKSHGTCVIGSKHEEKKWHSYISDNIHGSKDCTHSPTCSNSVSAVNNSFNCCLQKNETHEIPSFQDIRQENERSNELKSHQMIICQDPYVSELLTNSDVSIHEKLQHSLDEADNINDGSQSSASSASVKKPSNEAKYKDKILSDQTDIKAEGSLFPKGHSNHCDESFSNSNASVKKRFNKLKYKDKKFSDQTDIKTKDSLFPISHPNQCDAVMLQTKKHNISNQDNFNHEDMSNIPQISTRSINTRSKAHNSHRKSKRKHKFLRNEDHFGTETCLDFWQASNMTSAKKEYEAKNSGAERKNTEQCAKLRYSQKMLKHEFKSNDFKFTYTGNEKAIAIEDDEGMMDMMVERNTDLMLSTLLPWEEMKKHLCRRMGNLESYVTSSTEATQDHFSNTYKEISASRKEFMKNYLQNLENEVTASEKLIKELNVQEEKFFKVKRYIEHAFQKQLNIEENILQNRLSIKKDVYHSFDIELQQQDQQSMLDKHTKVLQRELGEIERHYYMEEYNEMQKKLQQRMIAALRIQLIEE